MNDLLDEIILGILVCPQDKGFLHYYPGEVLYNPRLEIAYPIRNGIPLLLPEDAIRIEDAKLRERYAQGRITGFASST